MSDTTVKPSCAMCSFWDVQVEFIGGVSGKCRRNPPAVISAQEFLFPITRRESWCGEFKLDVARQKESETRLEQQKEHDRKMKEIAAKALAEAEGAAPEVKEELKPSTKVTSSTPPAKIPVLTVEQMQRFAARKSAPTPP